MVEALDPKPSKRLRLQRAILAEGPVPELKPRDDRPTQILDHLVLQQARWR